MVKRNANASKGRVVSAPATVFEIAKLSRIELINGPTVVKGARKFDARRIIPMINKPVLRLKTGFSSCSFKVNPPNLVSISFFCRWISILKFLILVYMIQDRSYYFLITKDGPKRKSG